MVVQPSDRQLTAALHKRGVRFVGPAPAASDADSVGDRDLLAGLARASEPLLREALIPLLLLHAELAGEVAALAYSLEEAAGMRLRLYYTAAMYLQRLWRSRLELYLGPLRPLPDLFSAELGLPMPEEHFGELGLRRLAELHARRWPANHLAAYGKMLELLVGQLRLERAAARVT